MKKYSGTTNNTRSEREIRNCRIAREAAAEGIVLLKNEGILPLEKGARLALFGGGAVVTVKGGTGSGDVNEREVISIYQGLKDAGFEFSNKEWLDGYLEIYQEERMRWRSMLRDKLSLAKGMEILNIYAENTFQMPAGEQMKPDDFKDAKAAIYVISRKAGEGADRFQEPGDYYLSQQEKEDLEYISRNCENLVVIINAGGQIDLNDILKVKNLKGLLSIVQPGMEGGHALADILIGDVTPSGKLTDTWAKDYFDYPGAETYSHMDGNTDKAYYNEGIYVGYRYFDSFEKEVEYPFGYGLSYTDFSISGTKVETCEEGDCSVVRIRTTVKNTGYSYSGKEVVQIYVTCPQGKLEKEYKRLCGFAKTKLLKLEEEQEIVIEIDPKSLASYSEEICAWILEPGKYGIWVGNSSRNISLEAVLNVENQIVLEKTRHICPVQETLQEFTCPEEIRLKKEQAWQQEALERSLLVIDFAPAPRGEREQTENEYEKRAKDLVKKLSEEELTALMVGEVSKGQGQALGSAGSMVPGSAGETSGVLKEKYMVPGVSMADGPAGLRLIRRYEVDKQTGNIYSEGILDALEGGFLASGEKHENVEVYYQYCTAIPVGTLLAQSWNTELLEQVGRAVAEEMQEFGISWWLAPGMNIHRNPLCGRNFEYYSEDPLVSGCMAAAITRGVQSVPGTGTTIKHFACNNQEDNRMGADSILSERALREIYLRGFEIAIHTAQPMAVMTSYNLINGVHAANSKDLCTQAARKEWGFKGIIMTDWTTTEEYGGSIPWRCTWAGNDLIMPGSENDKKNIQEALRDGSLSREELEKCAERLLTVIFQTLACGCEEAYGEQFKTTDTLF